MTSLAMTDCPALSDVDCSNNNLSKVDFSGSENLSTVNCSNNNLTRIDLSNRQMLYRVDASQNQLNYIDVSFCPNLSYLNFRYNPLVNLYAMGDYSLNMIAGVWTY